MDKPAPPNHPITFSDRARKHTRGIINTVAKRLYAWHVDPDAITVAGTVIVGFAAIAITQEVLWLAGIIVIVGLPLDAMDGAVARLGGEFRPFGAFFDSTLDRYADGMLFGALAIYGHKTNSDTIFLLALVALVGAYLVSYTRARSEGLGIACKVGLFTRLERTIAMIGLLLTGWVLPGLWILAIGTQFTALQRIWYVRKATQAADDTTSTIS